MFLAEKFYGFDKKNWKKSEKEQKNGKKIWKIHKKI